MKLISVSFGVALACGALVLSGCDGEKTDTGANGGGGGTTSSPGGGAGGPGGAGPGGAGPGGTTDTDAGPGGGGDDGDGPGGAGPGTDDTGDTTGDGGSPGGGDGGDGGSPGDGGGSPGTTTEPGDDTALMAVAFYMRGTIDQSPSGDTMTGLRGIVGYGVEGGYVLPDDLYCDWYAETSRPGTSVDCDQCDFAFDMTYDTPGEDGSSCGYLEEGLGPYGYTGPEILEGELTLGFVSIGSSSYSGFDYDYGYVLVNYYSTWYYTTDYTGFTYDNYDDPSLTDFYAINGYYGISFTP